MSAHWLSNEFMASVAAARREDFEALIARGVSGRWLCASSMRFGIAGINAYADGTYQPNSDGQRAFILAEIPHNADECCFEDHDPGDLIAFFLSEPSRWSLRHGVCSILNPTAAERADWFCEPLALWRSPLQWMRSEGRGAVILDESANLRLLLAGVPSVIAEDLELGKELDRRLRDRGDTSGALASRFIVLMLRESFYGREDPDLTSKLLAELSGILNWAITGWQRLTERGHFVQPASSAEAIRELEDLSSPLGAFIRDRCIVGPGHEVLIAHLFNAWSDWCKEQGRDHPGTAQTFGRDLHAAVPTLSTRQPRDGGDRMRIYTGIRLK